MAGHRHQDLPTRAAVDIVVIARRKGRGEPF
jgi:hypothetical protein